MRIIRRRGQSGTGGVPLDLVGGEDLGLKQVRWPAEARRVDYIERAYRLPGGPPTGCATSSDACSRGAAARVSLTS